MIAVTRKLGKRRPRHDQRTAHFADFLHRSKLPAVPALRDWLAGAPTDLGMMRNDTIGDCGFAGQAHAVQSWSLARGGKMLTIGDDDVVAAYSACTGYSANDPSTDQGVVLLDALKFWRSTGIGGHKINAYVHVDPRNVQHVKIAIELFGGVYCGAQLPLSAEGANGWTGKHGRLTGDDRPGSWGGHCMWAPAYDDVGLTFVTWGYRQKADWQWWLNYADECWAVLATDWVSGAYPAPSGFDVAALSSYLRSL